MSITSEINQIKAQLLQVRAGIDCRATLNGIYTALKNIEIKVESHKAGTGFDSIPTETKQALNRFYQLCLQLKVAFEDDPDFEELINYR